MAAPSDSGHWLLAKADGLPPAPRGAHACVAVGTKLVLFGGADRAPVTFNDLWVLETADGKFEWIRISPHVSPGCMVQPRSGASLTLIGDKIYLFGGTEPVSGLCFNDVKILDPNTWTWTDVEAQGTLPPARHSHCAGCLAETCLIVYGGAGYQGPMEDIWIFNTLQCAWSKVAVAGPQPAAREMASGCMVDSHTLFVYGGRGPEFKVLCDAATFDARQNRWTQMEPTPFSRCAHSCVLQPQAGGGQPSSNDSDCSTSTAAGGAGGDAEPLPAPAPQASGRSVVVVYGGFSGEAVEGDVLRIDAATLEIELVRRGPRESDKAGTVPPVRFAHSAAVVPELLASGGGGSGSCAAAAAAGGRRAGMVVFGGVNPKEDLNDVAVWVAD